MSLSLKLTGLTKSFPGFQLGPIDLEQQAGSVLGLLGPNGAGKTTTIHMVTGLLRPDTGTIEVGGSRQEENNPAWKEPIGFVGEHRPFFESWSGTRNLEFQAAFYPDWDRRRARDLAGRLELDLEREARDLSKGNRTKLALVAAIARRPRILLFDEPTEGLDPLVRIEALDIVREYLSEDEGCSVLYATHVLSDITRLADELVFIRNGKAGKAMRTDALTDRWRQIVFRFEGMLPEIAGARDSRSEGDEHRITTSDHEATLEHLTELGARDIHTFHLGIDEIALTILRGNGEGAADA